MPRPEFLAPGVFLVEGFKIGFPDRKFFPKAFAVAVKTIEPFPDELVLTAKMQRDGLVLAGFVDDLFATDAAVRDHFFQRSLRMVGAQSRLFAFGIFLLEYRSFGLASACENKGGWHLSDLPRDLRPLLEKL